MELWKCYDIILDKAQSKRERIKHAIRLIISSIVAFITLITVYGLFNVTTTDLFYYLKHGIQ